MLNKKILYLVHCVDTEGPLDETPNESVKRFNENYKMNLKTNIINLTKIQNQQIDLNGLEASAAKCFSKKMLDFNNNWKKIDSMLDIIMSSKFRNKFKDDFGRGWVFSWHCVDHMGLLNNPRKKDIGYGKVFKHYQNIIKKKRAINDEINWHFHPLSITKNPLAAATSYTNNYELLNYIIARRILDNDYFPTVNRPGFHSERIDSNFFLESWIPFDYGNQRFDQDSDQPDMVNNRFGDWSRAPKTWRGYNPSIYDYQSKGTLKRYIFRTLNFGTRIRCIEEKHINEAFKEADKYGSAILAYCNHDYRNMVEEINELRDKILKVKRKYKDVKIYFSGAEEAAIKHLGFQNKTKPKLKISLRDNNIFVAELIDGEIFGQQPFLAIKDKKGNYYHDNFDIEIPNRKWIYTLDIQTIKINEILEIGIGTAGRYGKYFTKKITFNEFKK